MKIIDIHTHGLGGLDTASASVQEILDIARLQGECGVAEIVPTIYPSSMEKMREDMTAVQKAMEIQEKNKGSLNNTAGNKTVEARIAGIHLEGPFLNPVKCGALDAGSFLEPSRQTFRKLSDGFESSLRVITIAPELRGSLELITMMSDMGIIASMGHSDASYAEAEDGFHAGARGITHLFNAMRGIHHRNPGLAGFGLINNDVYVEVIGDPYHLDMEIIKLIFSLKGPDKVLLISDTVKASHTPQGRLGLRSKKDILTGGSMTLRECSEELIKSGIDRDLIARAISDNPAAYLKS